MIETQHTDVRLDPIESHPIGLFVEGRMIGTLSVCLYLTWAGDRLIIDEPSPTSVSESTRKRLRRLSQTSSVFLQTGGSQGDVPSS